MYAKGTNPKLLNIVVDAAEWTAVKETADTFGLTITNLIRLGLNPLLEGTGHAPLQLRQHGGGRPSGTVEYTPGQPVRPYQGKYADRRALEADVNRCMEKMEKDMKRLGPGRHQWQEDLEKSGKIGW